MSTHIYEFITTFYNNSLVTQCTIYIIIYQDFEHLNQQVVYVLTLSQIVTNSRSYFLKFSLNLTGRELGLFSIASARPRSLHNGTCKNAGALFPFSSKQDRASNVFTFFLWRKPRKNSKVERVPLKQS